jgi:phospholipid/cholesterol/gamma-HCH transport system ATP-binding protein
MRKRAGLARALVLDPQIILCDEPDSGLDPVRTAYLSQLLIDLNAQIDATILIVTHNINIARTVPDNLGMLFRRELIMFGPREVLLTSEEPVVNQFLNGRRIGPIGMSEEKDDATMAREAAAMEAGQSDGSSGEEISGLVPQLQPTPGLPERGAVRRRKDRVMRILHTLPVTAQQAIVESMSPDEQARYGVGTPVSPYDAPTSSYDAATTTTTTAPVGGPTGVRPSPTPRGLQEPASGFRGQLPIQQVASLPESGWQDDEAGRSGQL